MKSSQIDDFMEVVRCGSITLAAKRNFSTQPSVSRSIKTLEDELGFMLFVRTTHGAVLTEEGEMVYRFFMKARRDLESVIDQAKYNVNNRHALKMVISEDMQTGILREYFEQMLKTEGMHSIDFVVMPAYKVPYELLNGNMDIAATVIGSGSFTPLEDEQLVKKVICTYNHKIFYSESHPICQKGTNIHLADFKDEILYAPSNIRKVITKKGSMSIEEYFEGFLGFYPRIVFLDNVASINMNVEMGRGVAILIECSRLSYSPGIRSLAFESFPKVEIAFVWNPSNRKPQLKQFLQLL